MLTCLVCDEIHEVRGFSLTLHGAGAYLAAEFDSDGKPVRFLSRDALGNQIGTLVLSDPDSDHRSLFNLKVDYVHDGFTEQEVVPQGSRLYGRVVKHPAPTPYKRNDLFDLARGLKDSKNTWATTEIPAAYTYFAQFVAHEVSKIRDEGGAHGPYSWATPALDLNSVLDPLPANRAFDPKRHVIVHDTAVGWTTYANGARYFPGDLPRDTEGKALIPDQRNDSNLIVAQIHLAIIKLYQLITVFEPGGTTETWRRTAARHLQSIVLQDLLPRITGRTWQFAAPFVRKFVWPRGEGNFLIPLEFAAACFRFGHSMVREAGYNFSDQHSQAHADDLLMSAGKPLKNDWQLRWENLIRLDPKVSDPVDLADPVDAFMAYKLNSRMDLRDFSIEPTPYEAKTYLRNLSSPFSIHDVSLLRGYSVKLPSAQECVKIVMGDDAWVDPRPPYSWILRQADTSGEMRESTPLWFHVLAEAGATRGAILGPMATQIVAETLHAAAAANAGGIVESDGRIDFTPLAALAPPNSTKFTLPDLLRAARDLWPEHVFHKYSN